MRLIFFLFTCHFLGLFIFQKKKRNAYKDDFTVCLSVYLSLCLSVKSLYLRNAWRYQVEIQTIYLDVQPHDFLEKKYLYTYLKTDMAVCIGKQNS